MRRKPDFPSLFRAGALLCAVALGGCRDFSDVTGSIAGPGATVPTEQTALRDYTERWSKIYANNPGEKVASIAYARALRAETRYKEAAAVMQTAAVKAPKDYEVLGEYGKALADNGDLMQARDVLTRSYPADRPNWALLSVQGAVADRLDDHDRAQAFYNAALKIAPDEPAVLSNLGLSYALAKKLSPAEDVLKQAVSNPKADARVRQNLALVLALEGKFKEAEDVSAADMSREEAARNVQAIRTMIAQNDSWRVLRGAGGKTKAEPTPRADASG